MNEIDILDEIMKYFVDRERFIRICKEKIDINLFNRLMELTKRRQNKEFVSKVFLVGFSINGFNRVNRTILTELLLADFHINHEDIASLFQTKYFDDNANIPILLRAINSVPEYLKPEDFKYPYIRKLIYAVGAQPEPHNLKALKQLATETTDDVIRDLALHQHAKRKELGRWEAAKNGR